MNNPAKSFDHLDLGFDTQLVPLPDVVTHMVYGNALANSLAASPANSTDSFIFYAYGGNDSLYGGIGKDTFYGGAGNDVIYGASESVGGGFGGGDVINGGTGADTMYASDGALGISAAPHDTFVVDDPGDVIVDRGGSPLIFTSINYRINQTLFNADVIYTGSTAVRLSGNQYDNLVVGGSGNDQLIGGGGFDSLYGGNGNDSLYGGAGAALLYGGSGNDLFFIAAGGRIIEDVGGGNDTAFYTGNQVVDLDQNVETVYLGSNIGLVYSGSDVDPSHEAANVLIYGGTASTEFDVATGDTIYGGSGDDTYKAFAPQLMSSTLIEAAGGGIDTIRTYSNLTYALPDNIENLYATLHLGGPSHCVITGNASANIIATDYQSDTIYGGAGNDTIAAALGTASTEDGWFSPSVADYVYGGAGNDLFILQPSNAFYFPDIDASAYGVAIEVISDFTYGDLIGVEGQLIRFAFSGTDAVLPLPAEYFKAVDSDLAGRDANDVVLYVQSSGKVYIDSDGLGTEFQPVLYAIVDGPKGTSDHPVLTAADFANIDTVSVI